MSKKLGLYIDTTSVNWSLIDQKTNDLIDLGVYVFPAGCENFGAGRYPKNVIYRIETFPQNIMNFEKQIFE